MNLFQFLFIFGKEIFVGKSFADFFLCNSCRFC